MTHRSRLGVIVIDCETDDLSEACGFWTAALGCEGQIDADGRYAQLTGHGGTGPRILLQAVDHAPRVHLDIETDDIEAECGRLAAHGAREVSRVKSWVVMESPTGHRFCVVGPQTGDFPGSAPEWED